MWKVKICVFETLTAMLNDDGVGSSETAHPLILEGLEHFSYKKQEKKKYEHLVCCSQRFGCYWFSLKYLALKQEKVSIQIAALTFINSLISTPEEVEDRILIRNHFHAFEITNLLSKLKIAEASTYVS